MTWEGGGGGGYVERYWGDVRWVGYMGINLCWGAGVVGGTLFAMFFKKISETICKTNLKELKKQKITDKIKQKMNKIQAEFSAKLWQFNAKVNAKLYKIYA